jgi:putative ATP-dependent endonuclease of OLD family
MFLRRVRIESFRGIERLDLALDPTTILIGENNTGKTSLLDALNICLGPGSGATVPFRSSDFRRVGGDEGEPAPRPIRVLLRFREHRSGAWKRKGSPLGGVMMMRAGRHEIRLLVTAIPDSAEQPEVQWRFLDLNNEPIGPESDPALLAEVRRLSPFLLLRADRGLATYDGDTDQDELEDSDRRVLQVEIDRVYQELVESREGVESPELERGVAFVREHVETAARRIGSLEEPQTLLDDLVQTPRRFSRRFSTGASGPPEGSGALSLAVLLLTGAILRARGPARIAPDADPIVAVEEPEAHLHPRLLAAMWGIIDGFPTQKVVTTNSGELLAAVPLRSIRRLQRRRERIRVFQPGRKLTIDEMRRIGYHIRVQRGDALFARCWLLIEGETEFWLLPEFARILGFDFVVEGIKSVEFAQCGVEPLIKLAKNSGIEWHLLADGDEAGRVYTTSARRHIGRKQLSDRITQLAEPDMEHCLYENGYADIYSKVARVAGSETSRSGKPAPGAVIREAIRGASKPYLALLVAERASSLGEDGVPAVLQSLIRTVVRQARD